jgi:uncharacterized protein YkwD
MYFRSPIRLVALAISPVLFCLAVSAQTGKHNARNTSAKPALAPAAGAHPKPADLLAEINLARANPSKYAAYLEEMKRQFKGNTWQRPGRTALATNEGVAAVDEAIRFLRSAKPLPALHMSAGMSRAANDQVTDMIKNNISGHRGSDGSLPEDRCARYGRLQGNEAVGENIAYEGISAREVIEGFIVDDGTSNRGHRRNVFSTTYKVVGIGVGTPPSKEPTYVVTFADGFADSHGAPAKGKAATTRSM